RVTADLFCFFFFFFQAEDGIRDRTVTGVQTCALPISPLVVDGPRVEPLPVGDVRTGGPAGAVASVTNPAPEASGPMDRSGRGTRSEERRVGKECRDRRCEDE